MWLSIKNLFVVGTALGLLTGCQLITSVSDGEKQSKGPEVDPEAAEFLLKLSNVPPTESSCVEPPNGIVGWWPGDGSADDYSGYGHHGVMHGNMTTGTAYAGDGFLSEFEASYMEVLTTRELLPGSELTVETWVKLDRYTYYPGILSLGNVETFEESFSFFISPWGNISMLVNGTAISSGRTMLVGPVLPLGQWFHVAGVYDGSQIHLYVNGKREAAKPHTGPLYPAPMNIVMGIMEGEDDPLGRPSLDGALDEVSLYTRALSPAEISVLYNAGGLGKCRDTATLEELQAKSVIKEPQVLESLDQMNDMSTQLDNWFADYTGGDPSTEAAMTNISAAMDQARELLDEMVDLLLELEALNDPENPGDPGEIQRLEQRIFILEFLFNNSVDRIERRWDRIL